MAIAMMKPTMLTVTMMVLTVVDLRSIQRFVQTALVMVSLQIVFSDQSWEEEDSELQ